MRFIRQFHLRIEYGRKIIRRVIPATLIPVFSLALVFLGHGCGDTELRSTWNRGNIVVDGNYGDWANDSLVYFDRPSMFIGASNDENHLYLMIRTVDSRAQMKVMRLGITLWVEPPGQPEKRWGIHYPVGLPDHGIPIFGTRAPEEPDSEFLRKMEEMTGIMELLGPEDGQRVETVPGTPEGTDYGVRAAIRDTSGVIVYELRLPLRDNSGSVYTALANPGDRIILQLETGDIREYNIADEDDERYDPNRDTSTGKIQNKGRDRERERAERRRGRAMPLFNPLTEPITFRAEVTLAGKASPVEEQ